MHEELKQLISQAMNERYEFEHKLIGRAWEDEAFKQELLSNPKAVFEKESGQKLPKEVEIEVLQETPNKVYLVFPNNPVSDVAAEEELSEEALEAVAGGVQVLWKKKCFAWSAIKNANDL